MAEDRLNPSWRQLYGAIYAGPSDSKLYGTLDLDFTEARAYIAARAADGLRLTPTHLAIAALGRAIACDLPEANCLLRRGKAVPHGGVHVAVSVARPGGGAGVIIVRDANLASLEEIAATVREDAAAERSEQGSQKTRSRLAIGAIPWPFRRLLGRFASFLVTEFGLELKRFGLTRDSFGTVLVSNIGTFGLDTGMLALLPISRISFAIAIGRLREKAVVRDGQIVARWMLPVTATFDHRVFDGALIGRLVEGGARRLLDPKLLEIPSPLPGWARQDSPRYPAGGPQETKGV